MSVSQPIWYEFEFVELYCVVCNSITYAVKLTKIRDVGWIWHFIIRFQFDTVWSYVEIH